MADPMLAIATASSKASTQWRGYRIRWSAFVQKLRVPNDHKECGGYVLGQLRGDKRNRSSVVSRCGVYLDADKADADLPTRVKKLGVLAVVHTTYSSTEAEPRYRVIIPVDKEITAAQYTVVAANLMRELGPEQFDVQASTQPEHFMYWPATPDPEWYRLYEFDGPLLTSDDWLRDPVEGEQAEQVDAAAYADLPDPLRQQADAATCQRLDHWRQLWHDAVDWPEGHRDDKGRGWERLAADCAYVLVQLEQAAWSPLEDAEARYNDLVPSAVQAAVGCKITPGAGRAAERKPFPAPWDEAAADFELLPPESGSAVFGGEFPSPLRSAIDAEKRRMAVRQAAEQELQAETSSSVELPTLVTLSDLLAEPDEDVRYRVDELWPVGGRVVFAAPQKAGKSTAVGNVLRSLVDGDPFLDRFQVEPVQRVVLIDNELDRRMLRRWLRDQNIQQRHGQVDLVSLRGQVSKFDLLNPAIRARWAEWIGPCDVMLFDCLRPVLDALGLSEDKDAGRFLEAFDALLLESGSTGEGLVVHHMGHSAERARGDSRIQDWPDVLWRLLVDPEDELGPRWFWANGRDAGIEESELAYDSETRQLTLTGRGSRVVAKRDTLADQLLAIVEMEPGLKVGEIERHTSLTASVAEKGGVGKALRLLAKQGRVVQVAGARNAKHHYLPEHAAGLDFSDPDP